MTEPRRADDPPVVTATVVGPVAGLTGDVTAQTPDHLPNVVIKVVQPVVVIAVRSLKVWINTILGLLAAHTVTPNVLPAKDFEDLLLKCASLSVAAAVVTALTNIAALLGNLDQKFPTWTA